jgi:hypothetical protein
MSPGLLEHVELMNNSYCFTVKEGYSGAYIRIISGLSDIFTHFLLKIRSNPQTKLAPASKETPELSSNKTLIPPRAGKV